MSPCTKNCSLNNSTNIYKGFGRTLDEIVKWTRMTNDGKQQMMIRLSKTKNQNVGRRESLLNGNTNISIQ